MATERHTRNSASDGPRSSIAAKSRAPDATSSSRQRASGARGAKKSVVVGTSDTTTATEVSTRGPSIPAAIAGQRRTGSLNKGANANTDPSQGGGLDLTVVGSVRRDLAEIAKRSPELASSGFAATALALAREMDKDNSATSKSMCAKALVEALSLLRELSPPEQKRDGLDDLAARRAKRLNGGSAAAN